MKPKKLLYTLTVLYVLLIIACQPKTQDNQDAKQIAEQFLKKFRHIPDYKTLESDAVYPIYDFIETDKLIAYEVTLSDSGKADKGYIIASANEKSNIVYAMSTSGQSIRKQFQQKIKTDEFKICMFTPLYWVAIDKKGEIIKTIGTLSYTDEKPKPKRNINTFHERIYFNIRKGLEERKSLNQKRQKYNTFRSKQNYPLYYSGTSPGEEDTGLEEICGRIDGLIDSIEAFDKAALLNQLSPSNADLNISNANRKDFMSGCGATAWAMLLTYHNLAFTPSLLRGSQKRMGPSCVAGHEYWEKRDSNYTSRLMMCLSEDLNTYKTPCGEIDYCGAVYSTDMILAYDFVRYKLAHNLSEGFTWSIEGDDHIVQNIYDRIVIDRRPAVIDLPYHFALAVGFISDENSNNFYDQHLLVNTGWGNIQILSTIYLEDFWYFKDVIPMQVNSNIFKYTLEADITNLYNPDRYTPQIISTKSLTGYYDQLWSFWLSQDGKINYMKSESGFTMNQNDIKQLDVQSIYPPSLCTDGINLYLAYVDLQKSIHLKMYHAPKHIWYDLYFPEQIKTDVKPSITGSVNDFFTVVFSNSHGVQLISTNKDILRPNTWPTTIEIAQNNPDYVWTILDLNPTSMPVKTIINPKNLLIAFWLDGREDLWINGNNYNKKTMFYLSEKNGENAFHNQFLPNDIQLVDVVNYNNSVYLIDKNNKAHYFFCRPDYGNVAKQMIEEFKFSHIIKHFSTALNHPVSCATFIETENGKHPKLIVGWRSPNSLLFNSSLYLWPLSIDNWIHPISYKNYPECYAP